MSPVKIEIGKTHFTLANEIILDEDGLMVQANGRFTLVLCTKEGITGVRLNNNDCQMLPEQREVSASLYGKDALEIDTETDKGKQTIRVTNIVGD